MADSPQSRAQAVKEKALSLGFDAVGIAPAAEADPKGHLKAWLSRGFHGDMAYMAKTPGTRSDPRQMVEDARSVVVVALSYYRPDYQPQGAHKIARYAAGRDYHRLMQKRLRKLRKFLLVLDPETRAHPSVDTSAVLEREWARRAGLTWTGKSAMALSREMGSYFFLGSVITSTELTPDPPSQTDHCGSCTQCLDACPTQAFESPYVLDARKCITYWNVESRAEFSKETPDFSDWLFGCDICQEVCPWNKFAKPTEMTDFEPFSSWTKLSPATATDPEIAQAIAPTPAKRSGPELIRRNANWLAQGRES